MVCFCLLVTPAQQVTATQLFDLRAKHWITHPAYRILKEDGGI
jgi:hypothetical protein